MSKTSATPRRSFLFLALLLAFFCVAFGAAAWTAAALSPVGVASAAPTDALSFGYAEISKPTYTFTPTLVPTATLMPTETPLPMAQAEILSDTPAPVFPNDAEIVSPAYGGNQYILVDISEQHMYVYEGDALVYSFVSSTGMNNATRVGTFSVLTKIPNAYGATWDIWMPHWLGIYWAGSMQNGIHALPIMSNGGTLWAGYLGVPISYGCVVLGTYEAELLYNWAEIGTPVEIQW